MTPPKMTASGLATSSLLGLEVGALDRVGELEDQPVTGHGRDPATGVPYDP